MLWAAVCTPASVEHIGMIMLVPLQLLGYDARASQTVWL